MNVGGTVNLRIADQFCSLVMTVTEDAI